MESLIVSIISLMLLPCVENTQIEESTVAKLVHELKELKEEHAILKTNQKEQYTMIQSLQDNCGFHDSYGKSEVYQKRLLDTQSIISQMEVEIQTLKGSMAALQQEVAQDKTPMVGFTAILNSDILNLGDNQILVFNHIVTNVGNHYNPVTGVFTCETPGMYVFYVHTLAEPGKHAETQITKNLQVVAYTYAYDKEFYSSGSNMAVVNLQKGDSVLVRSNRDQHDHSGSIIDASYTSFSGFLVKVNKSQ